MDIVQSLQGLFWFCILAIVYAYLGYPLLIWLLALIVKKPKKTFDHKIYQPDVTLFVAAYNEQDFVVQKIENSKQLNYPSHKINMVWVTDGSNDLTNELLSGYPEVKVYYQPERKGKIHAMKRGMEFANTEIIVFTDANTLLDPNCINEMIQLLANKSIGCVAGEKRILYDKKADAAASGEGFYWKYESWVKKQDAIVGSTIGAAGELFAFRRELYQPVQDDAILDDFEISLRIAMKGYRIGYAPKAFALEKPSANVTEEMKRKIRIAAGSFQAMFRLTGLFNFFKHPVLTFQYVSHKVFRWVLAPLALALLIPLNYVLASISWFNPSSVYTILLVLQTFFYLFVLLGRFLRERKTTWGFLFIPYYFYLANIAMWMGLVRYCKKQQSVNWERAQRAM